MTGRCDEVTARTAFAKGAFDLLWKPLDREDLIQAVRCALATYRLRDLIDRHTAKIRRVSQLIERAHLAVQHVESSNPQFAVALDRQRRLEKRTLHCLMGNVQALTNCLTVREDHLRTLRERLASRLEHAHTRAMGRLAEVQPISVTVDEGERSPRGAGWA
jgi:FixJ family two-component response regulator